MKLRVRVQVSAELYDRVEVQAHAGPTIQEDFYRCVRRHGLSHANSEVPLERRRRRSFFPELATSDPQRLLEGSARLALDVDPPFDRKYIFVEKNAGRCQQLTQLKNGLFRLAPQSAIDIRLRGCKCGDTENLSRRRLVQPTGGSFLDPYGSAGRLEDEIEAVAATKAIDLWLLFPLGIGVNRLLTKSGAIPDTWRDRLTALLLARERYEEFYKVEATATSWAT